MKTEIEETYNKLKNKYKEINLPDFSELNKTLEINNQIYQKDKKYEFIERLIRRSITSTLNNHLGQLHNFIMPNQNSAIAQEEIKFLDEKDKKEVIDLVKEIMISLRKSYIIELEKDTKKDLEYISESFSLLKKIENEIRKKLNKLIEGWKKNDDEEKYNYVV